MAKSKPGAASTKKATAKVQKKAKAAQKTARKEKKNATKSHRDNDDQDDQDLEDILEKMRQEWEAAHTVTEELAQGPPSRRANATLTTCPNGNHLWSIGGEYFSEDGKAYFYNDVFRYSPDKDEWRKFVSQTCPGPRSAHSVVASPVGGGKLYLFGGEFSSLYQNSFHHYRDFWIFDIPTHTWERIESKVRPSARSGHRMAMWKHLIVLFGGFYDPGYRTHYLNDTWIFDTQEYKWRQIEFKDSERKPSPRSGFSFLPTPDGIVLHGGYCKEYTKGKRPVGVILDDTWFLKYASIHPWSPTMTLDPSLPTPLALKWEKRKTVSSTHTPSARAGCTMALWVTDEERGEERLESVFWNDLYGYQLGGHGRWISLHLKKPKKRGGGGKKKKQVRAGEAIPSIQDVDDDDGEPGEDGETQASLGSRTQPSEGARPVAESEREVEIDSDDPNLTKPMPRYNAMLAVLRNTLYIYGGIFELGPREYTLDDFYALQLDKLERFVCLKPSGIIIPTEAEESSDDEGESGDEGSDDDEEDDYEDDEGETGSEGEREKTRKGKEKEESKEKGGKRREVEESEEEPERRVEADEDAKAETEAGKVYQTPDDLLQAQATAFMGVSAKDATRSAEDVISTPAPGETLAMFYARSREYWAQRAHQDHTSDSRGKQLRRNGFGLAEARYAEYKPMLKEVEKILAEAGLDEDEMKTQGTRDVAQGVGAGQSRNRR
ncbi:galactose oxidase [Boletus coccyginus]|nr:galactose oxidase [Boletus coccyginus]